MATSTEAMILAAFMDRLGELVFTPPLLIANPNVDFSADGSNYLRADFIPNSTRQVTIGDDPQQKRGNQPFQESSHLGR
jgi:hypothetical protein